MPDPTNPINNQDGIEEIYFGKLLPEVVPGFPYWNFLSQEQRDYYTSSNNPNDPIRRAIGMQAREGYGIEGNPTFSQSVENTVTGIPGAIGENMIMEPLGALQAGAVELAKELVPGGKRGDIRNVLPGLTSAITGDPTARQELPSEYIGFENPEGFWQHAANFAIDAVTDPIDLIGGGLLLDGAKLLPKGLKSVIVDNTYNLASNIPKSSTELVNTGFKTNPNYHLKRFLDKKDEIGKAIRTDEGRKRIQGYIDRNPHLQNKTVDDIISDFENTMFETRAPRYDYQKKEWITNDLGELMYFDVDPNNAYNWYREGLDKPSYIAMGQNYTPYDAMHILEHEFAHLFQRGDDIAGVDDVLKGITLKNNAQLAPNPFKDFFNRYNPFKTKDVGYSVTGDLYGTGVKNSLDRADNLKAQMDYWLTGAGRGMEKAAFAAEIRENLIQRGILKNRYDKITPEMLKKHFKLYHNTKGDKYQLRLYDIMENNKNNFNFLSKALNRMPAVVPAATVVGAGAATAPNISKEDNFQEGGEVTDPEDPFANALQSRQPYRDDYMNKLLKYAEPGDDTYMRIEDAFADKFNTELTPIEKIHYKLWLAAGFGNPRDIGVYDIQGYWKSGHWKNNSDPDNHGTDTFKKPNHPTFSAESKYSKQKGGSEYIGGVWREDGGFMAGPHNFYDNDALMWEFSREPNRPEYLYMGLPAVTVDGNNESATQKNVSSFDEGGEVTDKNDPEKTKKKKAVILAETPLKYPSIYDTDETLPEEMQNIQKEYELAYESYEKASKDFDKYRTIFRNYLKGYLGEDFDEDDSYHPHNKYDNIPDEVLNSSAYLDYKTAYDRRLAYGQRRNDLHEEFRKGTEDFRIKNTTFLEEADRMKSWYEKNNQPYEIYPVYNDTNEIKEILSQEDIGDLVLMGHSGSTIAGIPVKDWNRYLQDSDYEQCILGSCFGNKIIDRGLNDVRNMSHTTDTPWVGVNPRAETKEGFYFPNTNHVYNP